MVNILQRKCPAKHKMNSFEYDDQSVYNPVSLEKHNHGIIKFNSKL